MVVTLAVITELGTLAAGTYNLSTQCHKIRKNLGYSKKDCEKLKELNDWSQMQVISADILLVLFLVALLAIFADWILFTRKVTTCISQHACSDWLICVCMVNVIQGHHNPKNLSFQPYWFKHLQTTDNVAYFVITLVLNTRLQSIPIRRHNEDVRRYDVVTMTSP